ncbi:MAG: chalcone isomerase family protein [Oceanisphaera sp.]|uniref:chalcone isomerase family protein n=1 Tax=Oceanisphaera sp. TaxID=1929979 RepID=UPI003C78F9A7
MHKLLNMTLTLLTLSSLMIVQPLWASANSGLVLVGKGQMSWMFFNLYQAHFYSQDGRYQANRYPQALTLRYQKNISQDELIKATISEWQRLGIEYPSSWPQQLSRLWPSVKKGDELAIRVEPTGESRFYLNQAPLGDIAEPKFGPAFLAIWLSTNSQNSTLTSQLKGN